MNDNDPITPPRKAGSMRFISSGTNSKGSKKLPPTPKGDSANSPFKLPPKPSSTAFKSLKE